MPAPKRGSSPHDPQPKMRKLDEDGEALPSKTAPADIKKSPQTGHSWEKTAIPRTKKKLSSSVEGGNIPAKSSNQGSPPKDSSIIISDPPVKKAKLLKATSASCGEAPSQIANSKTSLKRTASTESDDELSSDDNKRDLFRERADGDKARCIRQYSNKVKAKRRAEESPSDPQEKSQGSPSAPSDTIQMDHNYGRFSDSSSGSDANQDENKESEQDRDEISVTATQAESKETVVSATRSTASSSEFECAADGSKLKGLESAEPPKLMKNEALCRETIDSVTATTTDKSCITSEVGEKEKDVAESIKRQKDVDNGTQASLAAPLCLSISEANPDREGEAQADERTDSAHRSQTDASSESKVNTESVSEEIKLDMKSKSMEGEHTEQGVAEAASVSAGHSDVGIEDNSMSNKTNSAPEAILVGGSNPETEENLPRPESVGNTEAQTDLSFKIQVTFKEDSKCERLQDRVSHEVPDRITSDSVNKIVRKSEEKLEESERKEFPLTQTVAVADSGTLAEPQPRQELTTSGCTEITTADYVPVQEQSQSEVSSRCVTVSEGQVDMQTKGTSEQQIDSTPQGDLQNQRNHKVNDHTSETPVEVKEKMNLDCASAPNSQIKMGKQTSSKQEISNRAAIVEIQNLKEVHMVNSENDDEVKLERTGAPENRMEVEMEMQTTLQTTVEVQSQNRQEVSELTTDISTDGLPDITTEKSEIMENKDMAEFGRQTTVTPEISHPMSAVEAQSQPSPKASGRLTDISDNTQEHLVANGQSSTDEGRVEDDMQTTVTSEDISHVVPSVESEVLKRQAVTEPATDISENIQEALMSQPPERNGNDDKVITECISATEDRSEINLQKTAAPEEISAPAQTERGQEVGELTAEVQQEFLVAKTEMEENKYEVITECVAATENQIEINAHAAAKPGEISDPPSTAEVQSPGSLEVSELGTEAQKGLVSCESREDEDKLECVGAPEAQIHVETTTKPEEICNAAPTTEQQNQRTKEVNELPIALSDEFPKPPPMAHSETKDNEHMQTEPSAKHIEADMDVISGSIERVDPALEEETGRETINEVKGEAAIISSDKADKTVSDTEGHREGTGDSEVIVFVCGQPDETDVVIQASEEQIKTVGRAEVEVHENQVVYEPISSPESNDGREISSASENQDGVSLLDIQNLETQQMEGDSSTNNEENRDIRTQELENAEKEHICVSDMEVRTVIVPESCVSAQLEQSNMSVDVKQVAVISSSDDISMPDGQLVDPMGESERNGYPDSISATEFSEQLREGTGPPEDADVTVTTTTATTKVEIPDSTSEEFVILTPVPQSEIHFDIVTQAAAESGLSVSLPEQVNPDSAQAGEVEDERILNGPQQTVFTEAEVQQCQTSVEVKDATVTNSSEVSDQENRIETELSTEEGVEVIANSDHCQQPSADMMIVHTSETETTSSDAQVANEDSNVLVIENADGDLDLQEVQILEDIEIGREIVVAEEDNEEDSDITIIEKTQETPKAVPSKTSEEKVIEKKDDSCGTNLKNSAAEKSGDDKKVPEAEKPKKQEMNTQARTKARLAALAEQKAAASKRSANRQQLNLLALCQEIAEDIATDSNLLKRIEEEKQAAAAAAAAAAAVAAAAVAAAEVAAKSEASKKESAPVNTQDSDTVIVATPAGPEECSASAGPAALESTSQPSTADSAEAKPAGETPKRRFFISQVSVPLKAHEKKKLTRYQRLRQVELQREKMSWARVKKLKSDQANQMISDMDWQAPLSAFPSFSVTPQPAASPSKSPLPSPASTSKPATPKAEVPHVDTPNAEPAKTEPSKTEPTIPEPVKTEPTKPEPAKTETPKTGPPATETRKSTRLSKAQTPEQTPSPGPAPKTTRSAAKRTLPAVPPPMPNGLKAQKQKPVEYKPYRPRPKFTFDDFELDDDPVPVAPVKPSPQTRPAHLTGPNAQSNPTAQSKPAAQSRPTVSSQLSNQARLKAQTTPGGQISGQSKSAAAPTLQSKATATAAATPRAAPSAKAPLKPPVLTQSRAVSAPGQSKPAASASPQPKPTASGGAAQLKQATSTTSQPSGSTKSAAPVGSTPQKTPNPSSSEDIKCKVTQK